MPKTNPHIVSSNTTFLFCKSTDGTPLTIADVRTWLERVNLLNLPDSTELEGDLYLTVDYEDVSVSRIECGDCNPQCEHTDLLIELPHVSVPTVE